MFSHLSATEESSPVIYPVTDSNLPFSEYIQKTRSIIENRRTDLEAAGDKADLIIDANCPYEYRPEGSPNQGALLIHGLLDCPFTLRDIGKQLQHSGILTRSILLPGHGTNPMDLMNISYHDWLQAVKYGIQSLKKEVGSVYLVGFSTGAALAIFQALQETDIAGIILLSPAIKVRAPVDFAATMHYRLNAFSKKKNWVFLCDEIDYVKYSSIAFNAVQQVAKISETVRNMSDERFFHTPMYMILSREDETISSHHAIDYFTTMRNPESRMLLYSSIEHSYPDSRIETRTGIYPEMSIKHLSHPGLPFSPDNSHYGKDGDYIYATRVSDDYYYGAYNRIEVRLSNLLASLKIMERPRKELTFNPDFHYMAASIACFIKQ